MSLAPTRMRQDRPKISILVCVFGTLMRIYADILALTPFHSDDSGTLYTSETARFTSSFGYTYPEVVDWGVDSTQLSSNVRAKLNQLYNPTGSSSKRSLKEKRRGNTALLSPNGADHQWFVNIRVDKWALLSKILPSLLVLSPFGWSVPTSQVRHPVPLLRSLLSRHGPWIPKHMVLRRQPDRLAPRPRALRPARPDRQPPFLRSNLAHPSAPVVCPDRSEPLAGPGDPDPVGAAPLARPDLQGPTGGRDPLAELEALRRGEDGGAVAWGRGGWVSVVWTDCAVSWGYEGSAGGVGGWWTDVEGIWGVGLAWFFGGES